MIDKVLLCIKWEKDIEFAYIKGTEKYTESNYEYSTEIAGSKVKQ